MGHMRIVWLLLLAAAVAGGAAPLKKIVIIAGRKNIRQGRMSI